MTDVKRSTFLNPDNNQGSILVNEIQFYQNSSITSHNKACLDRRIIQSFRVIMFLKSMIR